jgi:hypothetical protein
MANRGPINGKSINSLAINATGRIHHCLGAASIAVNPVAIVARARAMPAAATIAVNPVAIMARARAMPAAATIAVNPVAIMARLHPFAGAAQIQVAAGTPYRRRGGINSRSINSRAINAGRARSGGVVLTRRRQIAGSTIIAIIAAAIGNRARSMLGSATVTINAVATMFWKRRALEPAARRVTLAPDRSRLTLPRERRILPLRRERPMRVPPDRGQP